MLIYYKTVSTTFQFVDVRACVCERDRLRDRQTGGVKSHFLLALFLPVTIRHDGEPCPESGRRLAVMQERLQRGQQQRRGEFQGELPVLDPGAGRRPLGQAPGEDAPADRVRGPLVLLGVLPPSHRQRSCQSYLKACGCSRPRGLPVGLPLIHLKK